MTPGACPICTRFAHGALEGVGKRVDCSTCGSYWISEDAAQLVSNYATADRDALSRAVKAKSHDLAGAAEVFRVLRSNVDRLIALGLEEE